MGFQGLVQQGVSERISRPAESHVNIYAETHVGGGGSLTGWEVISAAIRFLEPSVIIIEIT